MSTGGNKAWQALSDETPGEPDEFMQLFEALPVTAQQAVARGDIDYRELLERMTNPAAGTICPACSAREVPPSSRLGLCTVCARLRANQAFHETLAEMSALEAATREGDRLKQLVRRERIRLGLPLPRAPRLEDTREPGEWSPGTVPRLVPTTCPVCGRPVPPHAITDNACSACRDRAARRASVAVTR